MLNSPIALQSARRKDGRATGSYWEMVAAVPALTAGRDALFLGTAGGSAVEAMTKAWPDLRAQGVEIDPGVTDVGRRRFGLSIAVVHDDARRFVETGNSLHDIIVVDLYATGQIPSHVATLEFYEAVSRRLRAGGVVAVNVFSSGDPRTIVGPVAATMMAAFTSVAAAQTDSGNTILLAWKEAMPLSRITALLQATPDGAAAAAGRMQATLREASLVTHGESPLTDALSGMDIRAAHAVAAQRRSAR